MHIRNHPILVKLVIFFSLITGLSRPLYAKSVYAITNHRSSILTAYHINGTKIDYQTNIQVDWGEGAVGLALDPYSGTLFVTYDDGDKIELIDARAIEEIKYILTTDELAGIVFHQSQQKLYAAAREGYELYVYLWNAASKTLTLEDGTYKELEHTDTAYGLALDEGADRLFVTDGTKTVRYYDANDPNFGYLGAIPIVVDGNDREAVGIAFYDDNQGNKCLYTGAYVHQELNHFLVRTNINDINNPTFAEKDIGSSVIGVGVDEDTGLVYVTDTNQNIEVYNDSTFPSDPCYIEDVNIAGPADIILAGDVTYRRRLLSLQKEHDANDCLLPDDYITYTITYDANGHDADNVIITDSLPAGVDFNSAYPDANYDPISHTVTWHFPHLDANESNSVTLSVRVNSHADPIVGQYYHYSAPAGVSLSVRGFDFTTDSSNVEFLVGIVNDNQSGHDIYWIHSYNNLALSNGASVDHISWQLNDPTASALSSDALPTTPPVLDQWESIYGVRLQGERAGYILDAHVTSAVPEPATLLLLAIGGLLLIRKQH